MECEPFDWFDSLRSLTTGRSPAPSEVEGLTTGLYARSWRADSQALLSEATATP
jgi:hypothetical protein